MTPARIRRVERATVSKDALCQCGFSFQEHSYGRRKCAAGKFTPTSKETEDITPVVFRWWAHSVIALFPTLHDDPNPALCDSYQHVGQHGSAHYQAVVHNSRPATPAEYASLKRELESAPYHYQLAVYRRRPPRYLDRQP